MRFYGLLQVAHQNARNAVDNDHVILNKIHLSLFMASFPLVYSRHLIILGSCHCKKQIDVSFLCVCPLIDDEYCVITLSKRLWNHKPQASGSTVINRQTQKKLTSIC